MHIHHVSWLHVHVQSSVSCIAQGIEVDCFGTIRCFHGSLVAFLGDTPAAGLVGGFKEGVGSAVRGCRTCMIKNEDMCSKVCYFTLKTQH